MKEFGLGRVACIVAVFCIATAITSPAQTFTTLLSFRETNGQYPNGSLLQGLDGNFYGTTYLGGAGFGDGTVFEMTATGQLTTLYSFCAQQNCTDGRYPSGGLVQGLNGNFYGTTQGGGETSSICSIGCGTIFELTPTGKLTTLYNFCTQANCSDGDEPGALVLGSNGNFYGTTYYSGANSNLCIDLTGCGVFFEITPAGKFTTLYTFCSQKNCADGGVPRGLVQATDGNFYGVTGSGGAYSDGTAFKISPDGKFTILHAFRRLPMAHLRARVA
jgi:uncharacterized repeat protein (TIGR03803 family)